MCDVPQSLHRIGRELLDPAVRRFWSLLDGWEWAPREKLPPRWTWEYDSAPV
jgi:hypothetical protein